MNLRRGLCFFSVAVSIAGAWGCAGSSTGGAGGATGGGGASATGGTTGAGGGTTGAGGSSTGGSGSGSGGSGSGSGGSGSGGNGSGGNASGGNGSGGAAGGGVGGNGGGGPGTGGAAGAANGGSGGGGTTGTGGSGGAAGAAACPYKLCEGFESGTVGGIPTGWTMLKGYGNSTAAADVGLAIDQAHSGAMSLKSSSMATGQNRVQKALSGLGAVATKHWGRIFYKAQAVKPASGVIHVTMVALEGTTEDRVVDTVEQTNGTHQWIFNVPDDSCCTGSDYNWSFDTAWHCAEWYVDLSTQSYRFFSDGTEVTQIGFTNNAAAKMSAWTNLAVGEIFYQQPPSPFVLWFDDLAINDTQIGCK